MTKGNADQSNAVWQRISETAEAHPRFDRLRIHVSAITDELATREVFDYVDGDWVLSDRAWTDWIFAGEDDKYLDGQPKKKFWDRETPKWLDYLLLFVILGLAGWVSYAVGKAQQDVGAGLGLFLTSLGLVLSLATRHWKKFEVPVYYIGLLLGLGGLAATLISLVS
ncbi:hypothetical protein [Brevibacterium sp. CS2]|uniref:hypothetical protein n=1 Tax=Brevibacterium sp. CS2 TaxID=2575923 RepID=UPI0010C7DA07|nr:MULTISPECIES: hypothetical protein [Actinomycetes]MCX0276133.1 hypothetical protein [Nocardia zapadnayensis]QCP05313.1 hypothetical protein FDF13_08470 [Brevibacterium sp. CS2]